MYLWPVLPDLPAAAVVVLAVATLLKVAMPIARSALTALPQFIIQMTDALDHRAEVVDRRRKLRARDVKLTGVLQPLDLEDDVVNNVVLGQSAERSAGEGRGLLGADDVAEKAARRSSGLRSLRAWARLPRWVRPLKRHA
jgi:chloramphenicol 3-O-phosphotransferase